MGQSFVATDKMQLHGGRVVLQRQQSLPHNGVFLFKRTQGDVLVEARSPADNRPALWAGNKMAAP